MIGTELGNWRRTIYSNQLDPSMDGKEVVIMGWISSVRDHGNLVFILLNDKEGQMQITAKAGVCPEDIKEMLVKLKEQSTIAVKGIVKPSAKAPRGVEISPSELRVFSVVEKIAPFQWQTKTVPNIDTRLELRAIDLRRNILQHVFKMRGLVLKSIRDYLYEKEFLEVNTPKMIATATEGGAALFPIFYYNKEAFLAQSPQLYKEQLTLSFEKIFEIAPIFRAEASRTNRHLSEAISMDIEEAFSDYDDVMVHVENIIKKSIKTVKDYCDSIKTVDYKIPEIPEKIPQYTYTELVDKMQKAGATTKWGDDLYPSQLKKINLNGFYFIKDWPLAPKPFYVKAKSDDQKISESFDLMFGDLELSSGSTRIEKRMELEDRMKNKGFKLETFDYHLRVFDYGVPPHAGCGIGLERLMMALTGTENIRDATFYPRDVDRLTP
ncbi:aspartate--tRNA(Asn) ligase [Candidatus Nitrosotalea okcheonensis]|uniref:Aspartate--tRNA(Asp/Asn) ligase n=1 Tax=Candidatus Nitrosotalea okcheonensis TaxID=1903276 RepID=A0A2H1FD87_9ARCH|nr:aspartate--tRNA(Asn) ligase [Candidatus Nitrosotalea okcheonensis]SMH70711.1 Aspartate--tRNA ligase [Candidatus Nitrosotalea okcheonensis]